MPIVRRLEVGASPATDEGALGEFLKAVCHGHFAESLGQVGLDLGYTSCTACVPIAVSGEFASADYRLPSGAVVSFSIVYGSSRLFRGLDGDFNDIHAPTDRRTFSRSAEEEHAEQTAIAIADGHTGWTMGGNKHIYIDYAPCPDCERWFNRRVDNWVVHFSARAGNYASVAKEKKDAHKLVTT